MSDNNAQTFTLSFVTKADNAGLEAQAAAISENTSALVAMKEAAQAQATASNPMTDGSQTAALDRQAAATRGATAEIREQTDAIEDQADAQRQQNDHTGQALDQQQKQADSLRELTQAGRALVALQLAQSANQILGQLQQVRTEMEKSGGSLGNAFHAAGPALDTAATAAHGLSNGLSAAVASGNPLLGLLAGIGTEVADVGQAYVKLRQEIKDTDEAAKRQKETIDRLFGAQQIFMANVKAQRLQDTYADWDRELAKVVAHMEALDRMRGVQDDLAAARGQDASNQLNRQGRDSTGNDASNVAAGLNAKLDAMARAVDLAQQKVAIAESNVAAINEDLTSMTAPNNPRGSTQDQINQAQQKLKDAEAARDLAMAAVDELKAKNEGTTEQLKIAAGEQVQQLGDKVSDKIREEGQKTLEIISRQAEEHGAELRGSAKQAFDRLTQLLSGDATLTQGQAAEITQLINTLRTSSTMRDQAYVQGVTDLKGQVEESIRLIQAQASGSGERISQATQKVMDQLEKLVGDAIPDVRQTAQISNLLSELKSESAKRDQAVYDNFTQTLQAVRTMQQQMAEIKRQIEGIRNAQ